MTTEIIIGRSATMIAEGTHINGNSKPVYSETMGKFWPSLSDAANDIGVAKSNLSHAIKRNKPYNGNVYHFVSDADIPGMLARIQELSTAEEKAKAYDALMAEQEKARAKKEKHDAKIAKTMEKMQRRQKIYERNQAKANKSFDRWMKAQKELENLKGKDAE